jgi:hypothetical protein
MTPGDRTRDHAPRDRGIAGYKECPMRSSRVFAPALSLLLTIAAAVPAWALPQPKLPPEATDKPSVVVRVRPVAELLKDARAVAKLVDQEAMFDAFEPGLGPVLSAMDTSKPIGFYAQIKADLPSSIGILMLPVKDSKKLLDVLGTVPVNVNEKDGLYTVNTPGPFNVLFRFHGDYVYATVHNTPAAEAALAKNKVYTPGQLFDAKDDSLATVTFNVDALPNELKKKALDQIDELLREANDDIGREPGPGKEIKTAIVTELAKKGQMLVADAQTVGIRLDFDRTKETMGATFRLIPRKETAMAAEIARSTAGKGVGAGILGSPSAVKVAGYASVPDPLKKTLEPLIDRALEELVQKAEALKGDAKDLAAAVAPTLKAGLLDIGFDLHGPNPDGTASILVGARVVDGDRIETSLRRILGNLPAKDAKNVELDVAKVDGVAIHRIPAPPERGLRDLVGEDAKIYVALRKDLLLVGVGGETATMAAMKTALKSGPKTCNLLDQEFSVRNFAKILEKKHEGIVDAANKAFPPGSDDVIRYNLTGGNAAEYRISANIRLILFGILAAQLQNR